MNPQERYFRWLMNKVINNPIYESYMYETLLRYLDSIIFLVHPDHPLDDNRRDDGFQMRYKYASANSLDYAMVLDQLHDKFVSVFEMMVGFSYRTWDQVMQGYPSTPDPSYIFWMMVENLNLHTQTNSKFDQQIVDYAVDKMMGYKISKRGVGGLFRIRNCQQGLINVDMRKDDLWYQMSRWSVEMWDVYDYPEKIEPLLKRRS